MDKDARIKELEAQVAALDESGDALLAENKGLKEEIDSLNAQLRDREYPRLGIWRDGDDVYWKGRWLCDLRPHGPAGDEFGTVLTEVFPADGFISRSTKPRQVA